MNQQNKFYQNLISEEVQIGIRYQSIFELKNQANYEKISKLIDGYQHLNDSVLLKHQTLYALGQLGYQHVDQVKQFLIDVVNNEAQNNLSRHQAAQALANYFIPELNQLYYKHINSQCKQLRWTCQIAIEKIKHKQLKNQYGLQYFGTRQPAAPFSDQQFQQYLVDSNQKHIYKEKGYLGLLCAEIPLFIKYRIMYLMRNRGGKKQKETLCKLLSEYFQTQTSLLKHQICFILGQIGCQDYENLVRQCIQNDLQEDIVRHEALAAVASQSKDYDYLNKFINHPNRLIRQSAQVAQFSIKYWNQ